MLRPGRKVPALALKTLEHGPFDLHGQPGENGTLVVFYRGLHCPICIAQMGELSDRLGEFRDKGIEVVMVSSDGEERARKTLEKSGAEANLRVAYDLPLKAARDDWGLWISAAREGSEEPEMFSEPGMFYIRPDGTLYCAWVQSAPFGRPPLDGVLKAITFAVERGYPPRGTVDGPLDTAA